MDSRKVPPIRSLPRCFAQGWQPEDGPFILPQEEVNKLRKVLRLADGDEIALIPGDGTVVRGVLTGKTIVPKSAEALHTKPQLKLSLAQALPKGDKIETIVRMAAELGIHQIIIFPSDRTVQRWELEKRISRLRRLAAIAREAAEVSFRPELPVVRYADESLEEILNLSQHVAVLSEVEGTTKWLEDIECGDELMIVIGPEGGWSPRECELIGDRAVTMGPRVFRVDTAAVAAVSSLLTRKKVN